MSLQDSSIIAILGSRNLRGTIRYLMDFRRDSEAVKWLDRPVDGTRQSWHLIALLPSKGGGRIGELLQNREMDAYVFHLGQGYTDRVRGKMHFRQRKEGPPVSLGHGRAVLPGLAR